MITFTVKLIWGALTTYFTNNHYSICSQYLQQQNLLLNKKGKRLLTEVQKIYCSFHLVSLFTKAIGCLRVYLYFCLSSLISKMNEPIELKIRGKILLDHRFNFSFKNRYPTSNLAEYLLSREECKCVSYWYRTTIEDSGEAAGHNKKFVNVIIGSFLCQ